MLADISRRINPSAGCPLYSPPEPEEWYSDVIDGLVWRSDEVIISLNANNWSLVGDIGGATSINSAIWFEIVEIPPGATIIESYMTFPARRYASNSGAIEARIYAAALDSANCPTTYLECIGPTRTTGVSWTPEDPWAWPDGYNTPEIKSVIQAVVSRPGWLSGNNLLIYVENFSSAANAVRTTNGFWQYPLPSIEVLYTT